MTNFRGLFSKLKLYFVVIIATHLLFSSNLPSLELSLSEAKVHYSIEVTKQVQWPDESVNAQFLVGVVGDDAEFVRAFEKLSVSPVRGKSFKILPFHELNAVKDHLLIVFVPENKRAHVKQVFREFPKALIIVDGRVSENYHLISLLNVNNQIKIRINRENLSLRGFQVSVSLLELAGTKADLSEQLRDWESDLKGLLVQVQEKESELQSLNQILKENTALLESARGQLKNYKQELANNREKLNQLTKDRQASEKEIEENQQEIKKNEQDIEAQRSLILQRQQELNAKEVAVARLRANIADNAKVLEEQLARISDQNQLIENKDRTIHEQRNWLVLILIVSAVFFIMIYMLLKTNSLRRKANRKLKTLNSQLYELATTDGLTGLYNRRYFLEAAQKELLRQQRHDFHSVLMMIDIDKFKKVNDTYGHPMGDEVIKTVANLLKENMRKYDLVGRLGGEEFAMMLVDCDIAQATEIAERLCRRVSDFEIVFEELKVKVTVSIGLSQLYAKDTKVAQSIVRADKALYEAKNSGRDRVVVYASKS